MFRLLVGYTDFEIIIQERGDINAGLLDQRKVLQWVQKYIHLVDEIVHAQTPKAHTKSVRR